MPAKHDWDKVKAEYVEGVPDPENGTMTFPTLMEISQKHGVSHSTLTKRCAMEDWASERDIYRNKLESLRREKKAEMLASKAAEFDHSVFQIVEAGVRHVQGHFLAAQEALKESRGRQPMSMSSLEQLSRSLERFQRIGKLVLGESTDIVGGDSGGGEFYIVQEIVSDPELAERIKANFRQKIGKRTGQDGL